MQSMNVNIIKNLSLFVKENSEEQDCHDAYGLVKSTLKVGKSVTEVEKALRRKRVKLDVPLNDCRVEGNLFYIVMRTSHGENTCLILLHPQYSPKALTWPDSVPSAEQCGAKVTLRRCQKFANWTGMKRVGEKYCKRCITSCRFKRTGNSHPAPLWHYPDVTSPFERAHMDVISPVRGSDNSCR